MISRMKVSSEVFSKWRLGAITGNKAVSLEDTQSQLDGEKVIDFKIVLNLDGSTDSMPVIGLEYPNPNPKTTSPPFNRRQEYGIKIR